MNHVNSALVQRILLSKLTSIAFSSILIGLVIFSYTPDRSSDGFVATGESQHFWPPVNLSNNPGNSIESQITVTGKAICVAWVDKSSGNYRLLFTRSTDNGTHFEQIRDLDTDSQVSSGFPSMISSDSNIYIAWERYGLPNDNLLIRTSQDDGLSFNPIITLGSIGIPTDTDFTIAADGNNVYAVWNDDGKILIRSSNDNGNTFSNAITLNENLTNSLRPFVAASANDVYVIWLTGTWENADLFFSASHDNGKSFSRPINLSNDNSATNVPRIAVSDNNVYVIWEDVSKLKQNVLLRASHEHGNTFGETINLTSEFTGGSTLSHMAAYGSYVYAMWSTSFASVTDENQVMFTRSVDNGTHFDNPLNINNDSGRHLARQITVSGNYVAMVWEDRSYPDEGKYSDVYVLESSDEGKTFDPITKLNNSTGFSIVPQVVISKSTLYTVWQDNSTSNYDVFFATNALHNEISQPTVIGKLTENSFDPTLVISIGIAVLGGGLFIFFMRKRKRE